MARLVQTPKRVAIQTLCLNKPNQPVWGDDPLARALATALNRREGYDVVVCEPATYHDNYDYTINMYWPRDLKIPQNGKSLYWFQVPSQESEFEEFASKYDGILYASKQLHDKHQENHGGIMLPMSADPDLFCYRNENKQAIIVFVGNYGLRSVFIYNRYLAPLIGMRNFMIFGHGWNLYPNKNIMQHVRGILPPEKLPSLYNQSSVVLSIHGDQHFAADMVTTRVFEAVGCNALVISDKVPMAMEMFPEGVHFVEDGHETKALIDYYFDANHTNEHITEMHEKIALAKKNFIDNLTFNSYVDGLIEYMENL